MKKVYVGLSGGVDSAVSAALLKERGYDVVGAFIKIWRPEFTECTWKEDRIDAMRVCVALGIPYKELDLSEEYRHEVVDSMIRDYERGITPNPDVLCNRSIKFGHFAKWAHENGADLVATGHYARIEHDSNGYQLMRGSDTNKDQSYFLHLLTQSDLACTLFPVGAMEKDAVRNLAQKFELPVARKNDSQGLCFVGDITMSEFLSRFVLLQHGAVHDMHGKVIGGHDGAALYTVGQRHGFSIYDTTVPHFVVSVDTKANVVVVSRNKADAARSGVSVSHMHFIRSSDEGDYEAQSRYREHPFKVTLKKEHHGHAVTFEQPHIVAPGQSLVLYRKDICIGGGAMSAV